MPKEEDELHQGVFSTGKAGRRVRSISNVSRRWRQWRLARTLEELDELQGKLAAGSYDEEELDDVIEALQTVVRDNRLSFRDRDLLTDDLNRLKDFRAGHEEYYRNDEDAYHRARDDWYREQNWQSRLFQKVREDLDRVQSVTVPSGGDQFRFAKPDNFARPRPVGR